MTLAFDYYFSFRSPYSYLAAPQITELCARYDAQARLRVVLPIAVRIPGFFKQVNPLWPPYLARDVIRISMMTGIPFGRPQPDPIVMNMATGDVAAEQPYIHRISRIGVAASEMGAGLPFALAAGRRIWGGAENWHEGEHLADAAREAGLDFAKLERIARDDPDRLDAVIRDNEASQKAAGHWGVPLFVFDQEPFFGQDRIDHLLWRMKQRGLTER